MTTSSTAAAREWFHVRDGRTCGPTDAGDLIELLKSHTIAPDSLVWCQGMTAWTTPAEAIAAGLPTLPAKDGPAMPWLPPSPPSSASGARIQEPQGRNPVPVRGRAASPERVKPDSYLAAHWRGDYSLARSFWLNHLLIAGLCVFALCAATGMIDRSLGERPSLVLALTLPILALLSCVQGWQLVGTWRSAGRRTLLRGRAGLSRFVRTLLVIDMAGTAIIVLGASAGHVQAALSGLPVPVPGAIVRDQGRRIDFSGPITSASPEIFRHALALAPSVRLARLSSNGGSVAAGRQIATMVREAGLDTEVAQTCASACTLVFFGGHRRILRDGGRLGFHSYSSDAMTPQALLADEEVERKTYQAAGLPADFVERIFSVPSSRVWYPQRDEVIAAGFATAEIPSAATGADTSRDAVQQGTAAFLAGDYGTALRLFRTAAGNRNATAEYDLGLLYGLGLGVARDEAAASAWFTRAAADGEPGARVMATGIQPLWQVAVEAPATASPATASPATGSHVSVAPVSVAPVAASAMVGSPVAGAHALVVGPHPSGAAARQAASNGRSP